MSGRGCSPISTGPRLLARSKTRTECDSYKGSSVSAIQFVETLARLRLPSVFNPYSDRCPHFDLADAPARRRANLEAQLQAAIDLGVDTIWLGRDLGYRGGRRTGVAFTDEPHLASVSASFGRPLQLSRATRGPIVAERTAAVIWRAISRLPLPVFTWNVFPLHPHESGNSLTNRCHSRAERLATQPLLEQLIDIIRPSKIVAIGNDAELGLSDLGFDCLKVRHPSYGGVGDFERGIDEIYGITPRINGQSPTFQLL
jgi:hypothetical protein